MKRSQIAAFIAAAIIPGGLLLLAIVLALKEWGKRMRPRRL